MSQLVVCVTHASNCAGCAGNGACWVCLGTGRLVGVFDQRYVCHRCDGTGLCPEAHHRPETSDV